MKKIKVILIGAGCRGIEYTDIMSNTPEKYEIVAVAEPIDNRRNYIKEKHNLSEDMCFNDWRPLLEKGRIADIAVIATMDRDHYAPAMKAISLKYDLLLEKPIAPTVEECKKITDYASEMGVKVVICTVLRYTPVFCKIKDIIDSGEIGEVVSISHHECVGNVHQSHSFVRGNWGNEQRSSFMLLQKSCHDMDILQWLVGKKCKKVQSFGSLKYFKSDNAPSGAPDYCVEGCPHGEECPYNAVKIYYDDKENMWFRTTCTHSVNPTDESVMNAITNSQYGKCVFKCDNDVVDHQTVNILFEDGVTATFNMNAFNKGGRFINIMCTKGSITAALDGESPIEVYDFKTKQTKKISLSAADGILSGHGGGDEGIVSALYDYINHTYKGCSIPEIKESYYNHLIAFAAEQSRIDGNVVDFDEYVKSVMDPGVRTISRTIQADSPVK